MKHLLIALLLIVPCLANAQDPVPQYNLDQSLPKDTTAVRGTLANGFKYYIKKNEKPEHTAYMYLIVKAGHMHQDEAQLGLAHLLEHMGFNGTKHFKKDKLITYLESIGMTFGADLNASTGNYETTYKLTIPTKNRKNVDKSFQILEDWAHNMSLEEDAINAERPVVLEEFRRRLGSRERVGKQVLNFLYKDMLHTRTFKDDKLENIKNFETKHLRRFYKEWYRPNIMGLVVVGDVDPSYVENKIKAHFEKLVNPDNEKRLALVDSVPFHKGTKAKIITDPETTRTQMSLSFIDTQSTEGEKNSLKKERDFITRRLLLGMLNKRLRELSNSDNPPFINAGAGKRGTLSRYFEQFTISASVKETEAETGLEHLITELERVKRFGFSPEELQKSKKEVLEDNEAYNESKNDWNSKRYLRPLIGEFLNTGVLADKTFLYEFYKAEVPNISLEDVNALFKTYYKKDNRALILIAPEKEDLKLPTVEKLLAVITKTENNPSITRYKPQVLDTELIKNLRPKGSIVSEESKRHGIKKITLSNGSTVLYKKTDFDKDKVLFKAVSNGGTSLLSDADYKGVGQVLQFASSTGVGGYKNYELQELLSDKDVHLNSRVRPYKEELKGHARSKDLETLFQLIYLRFTAINEDAKTYNKTAEKIKASIKNRALSPTSLFRQEINKLSQKGNPRFIDTRGKGNYERILDSVPYEDVYKTYTERFENSGDFNFVFVGDFDETELKTLCETYIASLPFTADREKFVLSDFKHSLENEKLTVYKGLEDKATLRMYFEADAKYRKSENDAIKIFGAVLKQRLKKALREEEGGIYALGSSFKHYKRPYPKYSAYITFDCSPENIDALEKEALAVIKTFIEKGPTKKEVEAIKKNRILSHEKSLKKNSYWLGYLYDKARWNKNKFYDVTVSKKSLKKLTPRFIKSVSKKYITTPYLTAKLLPEAKKEK